MCPHSRCTSRVAGCPGRSPRTGRCAGSSVCRARRRRSAGCVARAGARGAVERRAQRRRSQPSASRTSSPSASRGPKSSWRMAPPAKTACPSTSGRRPHRRQSGVRSTSGCMAAGWSRDRFDRDLRWRVARAQGAGRRHRELQARRVRIFRAPRADRESPHHASGNYGYLDQVAALRVGCDGTSRHSAATRRASPSAGSPLVRDRSMRWWRRRWRKGCSREASRKAGRA